MSKFDEIRENVENLRADASKRGKNLLGVVADIMESMSRQNLEFAGELSGFAANQLRLPGQAANFDDYRERSREAFSQLGVSLKGHGQDLIASLKEVPGQIKDSLAEEEAKKAAPAKKGKVINAKAKRVAPKKAAAKKPAAKKGNVKKAAKKAA